MYLYKPGNPLITMPGLAVAIDALDSNVVMDGSNLVSRVQNLGSRGAGDASQSTDSRKPKFVPGAINGCPAFHGRHDSTNASRLDIADSTALDYTTFTSFTVFQRVADLGSNEWIAGKYFSGSNLREQGVRITNGDLSSGIISTNGSATAAPSISGSLATGTAILLDYVYDGANATIRNNAGGSATSASASVYNGTAPYTLFSQESFIDPSEGLLGCHYFFTRALSANEINFARNFLARRWRINLS